LNRFVCTMCKELKDVTELSSGQAVNGGMSMWCFDCDKGLNELSTRGENDDTAR